MEYKHGGPMFYFISSNLFFLLKGKLQPGEFAVCLGLLINSELGLGSLYFKSSLLARIVLISKCPCSLGPVAASLACPWD